MAIQKRRRLEAKTDYLARKTLLIGDTRVIFRKTNRYIIGQCVTSKEAQDFVLMGVTSKELENYGWPQVTSIKNLSASYLTGYLLGKKMLDKDKKTGILDIGLIRSINKSKIYSFLKGLVDAGINIKHNPKVFPEESRIQGKHLSKTIDVNKIKSEIDKKFK